MSRQRVVDAVRQKIRPVILDFLRKRASTDAPIFHADELRTFVSGYHPTAPESVGRELRYMRRDGLVRYHTFGPNRAVYSIDVVA